jgi:hypothetical protein
LLPEALQEACQIEFVAEMLGFLLFGRQLEKLMVAIVWQIAPILGA